MRKSFATLKSLFNASSRELNWEAVREFITALLLLGLALFFALSADSAARHGDTNLGILLSALALLLTLIITFTMVPRMARRVDISRWRMPFSFRITREGGIYILLIFILSMAAINTGNNLLFLILSAMLAAIITSGIVSRASLREMSVTMQVPENVFEGELVSLKVSVRNQKRLFPSISISVEDSGRPRALSASDDLKPWWRRWRRADKDAGHFVLRRPAYFPVIPPGEIRSELVSQSFPRRGPYRLKGFEISTRFPLGFFERGERVEADGEVVVYPSVREVSSYFHLLPFLPGRLEGMHLGYGKSLYSIRKYQEGESARIVDWKATAKTGELMARDYAREEESKFCLLLDTLIHPPPREQYLEEFERAVSLAASLAAHFCDEGAELEFLTPREYVPRGIGTPQLYRILRSLALVQCEVVDDPASMDLSLELAGILEGPDLQQALSDKVFKIIITSKPRGSFPSTIWRSSHVVYFDEL